MPSKIEVAAFAPVGSHLLDGCKRIGLARGAVRLAGKTLPGELARSHGLEVRNESVYLRLHASSTTK